MGIKWVAVALSLSTATPAAAQALFGWSGSWEITQDRGSCTLRHVAKDPAATEIAITRWTRGWMHVSLAAKATGWPFDPATSPRLLLIVDGVAFSRGSESLSGDAVRNGFTTSLWGEDFTKLLAARTIIFRSYPSEREVSLTLPPSAFAERDLERCLADARIKERGSGATVVTPPRLRGRQENLMTPDDYPGSAIRTQTSGTVTVRLTVTAYGYASDCAVIASSGSEVLDKATCGIYSRRARFEPALDAQGRATAGSYGFTKQWVAPPLPPVMYAPSTIKR
ncbi:energy transducer TonB [Sphingomonas sp. LB-2]|nr:energy transducer TonB [Sphingomonas caeni]